MATPKKPAARSKATAAEPSDEDKAVVAEIRDGNPEGDPIKAAELEATYEGINAAVSIANDVEGKARAVAIAEAQRLVRDSGVPEGPVLTAIDVDRLAPDVSDPDEKAAVAAERLAAAVEKASLLNPESSKENAADEPAAAG